MLSILISMMLSFPIGIDLSTNAMVASPATEIGNPDGLDANRSIGNPDGLDQR